MGNHCCGQVSSSSAVWAGDDWGSVVRGEESPSSSPEEKHGLLLDGKPSPAASREVKVKISRKRLEEMVNNSGRAASSGATGGRNLKRMMQVEETVERLIEKSEYAEIHRQRSWEPALESIPELNSIR